MTSRPALILAAALALAGCRPKEITSLERKEAASDVSEAEFAVTMREWSRAEGLYAHAAGLCPDEGDVWANLGAVRMRLHDPSGARSAYKSALSAFAADCRRDPLNSTSVIRRASMLVLLGRPDEARNVVSDAAARNPDDRRLRAFVEDRALEKMISDPALKEISP